MHRTPSLTAKVLPILVLILAALSGCTAASTGKGASSGRLNPVAALKVSVSYRERILLPPGCTPFLELQNISRLDPEDNGVANAFLPVKAAPPFKAILKYDPEKIIARLHYAVSARIELKGQVLFSGSARVDPLSWPKDKPLEIRVAMARH